LGVVCVLGMISRVADSAVLIEVPTSEVSEDVSVILSELVSSIEEAFSVSIVSACSPSEILEFVNCDVRASTLALFWACLQARM